MPQSQTAKSQTNDYQAIDPQQDPLSFFYQHRGRLKNMEPKDAARFLDTAFSRFLLPKYASFNRQKPLDDEELERLRLQFVHRMLDIPGDQETKLKEDTKEPGLVKKAAGVAAGAGAGVIGGLRSIQELREKLQKYAGLEGIVKYDPLDKLLKKTLSPSGPAARTEGKAYEEAETISPTGAKVAAGIGHQIPASIATAGVGSILPSAGAAAPLAQKVLMGASRGAVEGGVFEATRPGGDPRSGSNWGAVLGAAFPMLGKMFGLGRKALASAPKVAEAVGSTGEATAKAASVESKSLGSLADKAAKDKFGKAFKDLTSAEKAQMPSIMKEEIAKQRAQASATKKATVAAAKAGREAEAEAKRTAAADAAKQKAAQQAAKRAAVPTQTPAAKQAVAAKAAEENPSIAKTLGGVDRRVAEGASPTGAERRVSTIPFKDITTVHDLPTEGEKLGKEIRTAREGTPSKITEGEAMQHIMKDPKKYEAFKAADSKEQGKMLVAAKNEMTVKKVPEGQTGEKIRAKGGQPASPAQQAADRERIAAKRAEAKSQEFGAALEKHAQQMAGKYTSATQVGAQHIPELEEAAKEIEGGEVVLRGLQKLRRAKKITDEIYADSIKEWLLNQFSNIKAD